MMMLAGVPTVDVPWGDVMRLCGNGVDLPGNSGAGGLSVSFMLSTSPAPRQRASKRPGGDSFTA